MHGACTPHSLYVAFNFSPKNSRMTHRSPPLPLHWRPNGRNSVSNHQPHDCLFNRLFRRRSKEASKLRVTGLCAVNSPGTGEFRAQMASNAVNVSIWWRHHDGQRVVCLSFQVWPKRYLRHRCVVYNVVIYRIVIYRESMILHSCVDSLPVHRYRRIWFHRQIYCFVNWLFRQSWKKILPLQFTVVEGGLYQRFHCTEGAVMKKDIWWNFMSFWWKLGFPDESITGIRESCHDANFVVMTTSGPASDDRVGIMVIGRDQRYHLSWTIITNAVARAGASWNIGPNKTTDIVRILFSN